MGWILNAVTKACERTADPTPAPSPAPTPVPTPALGSRAMTVYASVTIKGYDAAKMNRHKGNFSQAIGARFGVESDNVNVVRILAVALPGRRLAETLSCVVEFSVFFESKGEAEGAVDLMAQPSFFTTLNTFFEGSGMGDVEAVQKTADFKITTDAAIDGSGKTGGEAVSAPSGGSDVAISVVGAILVGLLAFGIVTYKRAKDREYEMMSGGDWVRETSPSRGGSIGPSGTVWGDDDEFDEDDDDEFFDDTAGTPSSSRSNRVEAGRQSGFGSSFGFQAAPAPSSKRGSSRNSKRSSKKPPARPSGVNPEQQKPKRDSQIVLHRTSLAGGSTLGSLPDGDGSRESIKTELDNPLHVV